MATFGIYQTVDPLYVTPSGSVCSGRIVGGENAGRIAVKILNPPKPDPDEPNWAPKYFLDRAQVQRQVAAAGGGHWAPVYSLGFTPEGGAYYVTDYLALSAQKMIDGRVPLDAAALHGIVRSVLGGLDEIRRVANRSHANLKPSNVLLVGKGPADELRAVLSDPGQDYKAQKDGEAGDLHAVGALIHGLVLYRPPSAAEDVAAANDPPWERLGDKAGAWRQLCAELLSHPIAPRVATLAGAIKAVDALAPHKLKVPTLRLHGKNKSAPELKGPKIKGSRTLYIKGPGPFNSRKRVVQVLVAALLVGGGIGVLSMLEANAREELCAARENWFGSLVSSLAEPARRERLAADPHLRRVVEGVDAVERANVKCDGGAVRVLGFLQYHRTRAAVAALHDVEQYLAPESWPQLAKLRELARTFEQRGWQQPAGYIGQMLEGVRPRPGVSSTISSLSRPTSTTEPGGTLPASPNMAVAGNLAQRIERVLRLQPVVEQQAAASETDWKLLHETATALEASQDSLTHNFGDLLRRDAVSTVKITDEGFEGLNKLKANAAMAFRVTEAIRVDPPINVNGPRFARDVLVRINSSDPEIADVQRWLTERPQYVIKRDQIAKAAGELQKKYETTQSEVAKSVPEAASEAGFEQEQKDIEGALREFRQASYTERDVIDGTFARKVVQIESQIGALKNYYHAEDAADWLKNLAPLVASSDRLKTMWRGWVATLQADLKTMGEDQTLFARNKSRTDKLRDTLTELELNFPHPPGGLSQDFATAAAQRREEDLGKLVDGVDLADPQLKPDKIKQSAAVLTAWFENLAALNKDFPLQKTLLTIDDEPDQPWRKNEAFWKDATVQRLIRADVDRIDRLQKIRAASRAELRKAAALEGAKPEAVVAAWLMLGEKRVTPAWPSTVVELREEADLRGRISSALGTLGESPERKPFDEALAREGPRRWRQFVESADREEMLAAAIELRRDFQINAIVLADMSPAARFNVWLYLANLAIRDNNATGLQTVVENLTLAARELGDQRKEAAKVLDKLAQLKVPDPFADKNLTDVFAMAVPGLEESIEFRRVEPKDGARPFYIGTREVTLGQFAGAIEGASLWPEARKLTWPARPGKGDARRGPRVWEWTGDATSPKLVPTALWMYPDDVNKHNDFPSEFHPEAKFNRNIVSPKFGGMPSDRHPMQYVSAQAALFYAASLNCRLPTSSEWRAALEATDKNVQNGDWNLRDGMWESFAQYAAKQQIPVEHWPERGAFPNDNGSVATPVKSRPGMDNVLLFRPSTSNDGVIRDLVGNVAEFVCEVPDAFAKWTDKRTADDLTRFLTDTPDPIAVIGGSALSPAEMPLDKPLPVTRTDRGFSDVGLRLAFTAPARNLAERLKWVLAGEDYAWPRTASADTGTR